MQVWLVRHAHAVAGGDDAKRALSAQGRDAAHELGKFFRKNGVLSPASVCWHSPLVRAVQTAELLCDAAGLDVPVKEVAGLLPEDNPVEIAELLEKWDGGSVIAVGHEPHMSALGTLLVRGKTKPVQFEMKKGSVLALESTGGTHRKSGRRRWEVRWLLAPALIRGK